MINDFEWTWAGVGMTEYLSFGSDGKKYYFVFPDGPKIVGGSVDRRRTEQEAAATINNSPGKLWFALLGDIMSPISEAEYVRIETSSPD